MAHRTHSTKQFSEPDQRNPTRWRTLALVAGGMAIITAGGCASRGPNDSQAHTASALSNKHIFASGVHVVANAPESCPVCSLYNGHRDSVVLVRTDEGLGSGVVIDDRGSVITNAHVVKDQATVLVQTYHGTVVRGRVERAKPDADLALIRSSASDVAWVPMAWPQQVEPGVGSTIYVIGHPVGLGWTLTEGIVSGVRPAGQVGPFEAYQIDAAVSPGNSGGPVLDSAGNWVGVVSSKLVGPGLENIAFVIPVAEIERFVADESQ